MNKVMMIGNLTRDPELTQTGNGISLCRMSIAVNRPFANASGEREADFFNVVVWRAQAENCQKFLHKGSKVGVSGYLQTRTVEGNDGTKRYFTEIVAEEVEFLSPREGGAPRMDGEGYQPAQKKSIKDNPPVSDDELPF